MAISDQTFSSSNYEFMLFLNLGTPGCTERTKLLTLHSQSYILPFPYVLDIKNNYEIIVAVSSKFSFITKQII